MKLFALITLFSIFFISINCSRLFVNRNCSSYTNATHMNNFQIERFAGKWYEIAKYMNTSGGYQLDGCSYHNISYNNFTHRTSVTTITKLKKSIVVISNGTIDAYPRGLSWKSDAKNEDNILVLGTDYETYAILWNCIDHPMNTSSQNLTILSKHIINPNNMMHVGDILKSTGIQNDSIPLTLINRDQCNSFEGSSGGSYSPGYGRPGNSASTQSLSVIGVFLFLFPYLINFQH